MTWAAVVGIGVEQALLNLSVAEKRAMLKARSAHTANDNSKESAEHCVA